MDWTSDIVDEMSCIYYDELRFYLANNALQGDLEAIESLKKAWITANIHDDCAVMAELFVLLPVLAKDIRENKPLVDNILAKTRTDPGKNLKTVDRRLIHKALILYVTDNFKRPE